MAQEFRADVAGAVGVSTFPSAHRSALVGTTWDGRAYTLGLGEEQTRELLAELSKVVAHWDAPAHRPGIAED